MSTPRTAVQPRGRRRRPGVGDALGQLRRSPWAFDIALAVLLALATLYGSVGESHPAWPYKPPAGVHLAAPGLGYVLVAVSALALIWRRRRPVLVLAVSLGAVLVYTCLSYFDGAALINPMFALYAVAVAVPTGRAIGLSVITMLSLMGANAAFDPFGVTGGGFVLIPGLVAAALFLGLWVASRKAYALRESAEQARRAVDTERLRIARELHDVVAHTMATINVQSGVAAHVIDRHPDQAAQALESIRQASKDGLRELRSILNVLRQADEPDERAPAPRLAQLDALIENATRAGLPTSVTVHGQARMLAPTVDLTAYRIVQESLTNALRYAGPTSARVMLSYTDDQLSVEVLDRGRGRPDGAPQGAGHGIAGMRERAEAVGGTLIAGPDPEGGFRVEAHLPLSAS